MENDKTIKVPSTNEVPLGHKIALKDLKTGDTIFKYGHDIGKVVKEIKKGDAIISLASLPAYQKGMVCWAVPTPQREPFAL